MNEKESQEGVGVRRMFIPNGALATNTGDVDVLHFGNMLWTPGDESFIYNLSTRRHRKTMENKLVRLYGGKITRYDLRAFIKWLRVELNTDGRSGLDFTDEEDFLFEFEIFKEERSVVVGKS